MQKQNLILEKSYAFGLRIIKLHAHLKKQKAERDLIAQLLRAGTSIGANVEEAIGAQSKADFIHKLSIAYKEARETSYWLRLLRDSGMIENKLCTSFIKDSEEIKKILTAILIATKNNKPINF
ncbi:MAG: four helix bundle protein [Ferruginibacter sp.]